MSTKPSPQNTFYFSKWCQIKQKKFEHTIGAPFERGEIIKIFVLLPVSPAKLDLNNLSLQINKVCISYSVHTSCLHLGWSYCKGSRCFVLNVHILEIVSPTKRLDIYFKVKFICLRIKSSFILKVLLKLGGLTLYAWTTDDTHCHGWRLYLHFAHAGSLICNKMTDNDIFFFKP